MILNGVDLQEFRSADGDSLRREIGLDPATPVIGSIGRLEPIKAYDVMLDAFFRLLDGWDDAADRPVLVVAGEGSERTHLEAMIRGHGSPEAVRLLGWRDDVGALHALFTLFTMSSDNEGTSVSLLEAMGVGLCPIVTDVGGNAAVLGSGLAHRLVPAHNPDALAAAWGRALANRAQLAADAATGRKRVESDFSMSSMVRSYGRLYMELSEQMRASASRR